MPSYTSGGVIVDAEEPISGSNITAEIGSITSVEIGMNVETVGDDGGLIYDEGRAITQVAPIATATSKSIAEVLSVIGIAGTCFKDAIGNPGVTIYGKNRGDCLTTIESDDHTKYVFSNGLLKLGTLQADRGADATLSFMIDAITDGTNAPLILTHDVSLPGTLVTAQYEIGLCAIAGTQFRPESVTIDFGVQSVKPRPLAPSIWPERIAVQKVQPVITLRGIDPRTISSSDIDLDGEVAAHTNTKIQLVKRTSGGSYVASATTSHIYFTAAGLGIVTNPFSAQGQADATVDVRIECIYDGTNAPILFGTSSAYDTSPES